MSHSLFRMIRVKPPKGWQQGGIILTLVLELSVSEALYTSFKFSLTKLEVGIAQVLGLGFSYVSEVMPNFLPIAPFFFSFLIRKYYLCGCCASVHFCVSPVCLVPKEARRRCWSPWDCSYRQA